MGNQHLWEGQREPGFSRYGAVKRPRYEIAPVLSDKQIESLATYVEAVEETKRLSDLDDEIIKGPQRVTLAPHSHQLQSWENGERIVTDSSPCMDNDCFCHNPEKGVAWWKGTKAKALAATRARNERLKRL